MCTSVSAYQSNMKGALMSVSDKLLLQKRAIIETVNNGLMNIAQVEHSRHRSFDNFVVNMHGALAAYCKFPQYRALTLTERQTHNSLCSKFIELTLYQKRAIRYKRTQYYVIYSNTQRRVNSPLCYWLIGISTSIGVWIIVSI